MSRGVMKTNVLWSCGVRFRHIAPQHHAWETAIVVCMCSICCGLPGMCITGNTQTQLTSNT